MHSKAESSNLLHWIPDNLRDGDGRNSALLSGLGWMQSVGFTDDEIREEAHDKNSRFAQPMEHREVERVIESALRYPKGERKSPEERRREQVEKARKAWIDHRFDELVGRAICEAHRAGQIPRFVLSTGETVNILSLIADYLTLPPEFETIFSDAAKLFPVEEDDSGDDDDSDDDELDLSMFGVGGDSNEQSQ